ncbi:MAG: hypothetical protein ACOCX0_01120 [Bacteroidota bacterium]
MSTRKNRTDRLKAHLKKRLAKGTPGHDYIFKNTDKQSREQKTIMEMWDNYLTFARAEF